MIEIITFSGSNLELLAWIVLIMFWTAFAFAAGWLVRDMREDNEDLPWYVRHNKKEEGHE